MRHRNPKSYRDTSRVSGGRRRGWIRRPDGVAIPGRTLIPAPRITHVALAVLIVGAFATQACDGRGSTTPQYLTAECPACLTSDDDERCVDQLDNDEDGLTDCADPDCAGAHACTAVGPEDIAEWCNDGLDNDGNGYTDCVDWSCIPTAACRTPQPIDEDTPDACSDGLDSDWNGYIDCMDFSCQLAEAVTFCEGSDPSCDDGIDNDGNGYTDCADFACNSFCE